MTDWILIAGFTLTITAILVKGRRGPVGDTGPVGAKGDMGPKGDPGCDCC